MKNCTSYDLFYKLILKYLEIHTTLVLEINSLWSFLKNLFEKRYTSPISLTCSLQSGFRVYGCFSDRQDSIRSPNIQKFPKVWDYWMRTSLQDFSQ